MHLQQKAQLQPSYKATPVLNSSSTLFLQQLVLWLDIEVMLKYRFPVRSMHVIKSLYVAMIVRNKLSCFLLYIVFGMEIKF